MKVRDYFRFVKIEHTLFSLPIVFSGAFLGLHQIGTKKLVDSYLFLWIFLAVLGARSIGFGLNRIIDRTFDSKNPRTKDREIPSGKISLRSAWFFIFIASALYFISAGMISTLALFLSPIPPLLFFAYPFLKRWTIWSHLGLGIAWGIAPIGGWLAVFPQIHSFAQLKPVLLLSLFSVFWVAGFDIIYALLDERFDRENGLFSMPAFLGKKDALRVSEISHLIAFLFLGTLVQNYLNRPLPFLFLVIAGLLLIASHWKVQFQGLTPQTIHFAFFKVNAILGFVVFLLVVSI